MRVHHGDTLLTAQPTLQEQKESTLRTSPFVLFEDNKMLEWPRTTALIGFHTHIHIPLDVAKAMH